MKRLLMLFLVVAVLIPMVEAFGELAVSEAEQDRHGQILVVDEVRGHQCSILVLKEEHDRHELEREARRQQASEENHKQTVVRGG